MSSFPTVRPRRLRMRGAFRRTVAETRLHPSQFVLPVFVVPGVDVRKPIESMPGHAQVSVDQVAHVAKEAEAAGVGGIMFFGVPDQKDDFGSSSWDPSGPVSQASRPWPRPLGSWCVGPMSVSASTPPMVIAAR